MDPAAEYQLYLTNGPRDLRAYHAAEADAEGYHHQYPSPNANPVERLPYWAAGDTLEEEIEKYCTSAKDEDDVVNRIERLHRANDLVHKLSLR
jgi:hypothetical protein